MERKENGKQSDSMEYLNQKMTGKTARPVRVLQYGEGNFLRAFADLMIDEANERGVFDGDVVIVKPTAHGSLERFERQECQYTAVLRGIIDGEPKEQAHVVTCVADAVHPYEQYETYAALAKLVTLRFVISNTTEAGIVYEESDRLEDCPPKSFPGKLCKLLYERYLYFQGDPSKGLILLPAELIDDNGKVLRDCVLRQARNWGLEEGFEAWVKEACIFASTLVDRIVAGYPREEASALCERFGYQDDLITVGEPFGLWVIESEKDISEEFPLPKAGLPVIFTENIKPYKQRKVRILNGAHTSFVLASFLCGNDIVRESMEDETILRFIQETIYGEVIPTLELPPKDLEEFAAAVLERFRNPYVRHALLSISLNSVSKWRARCMPSLLSYAAREGRLPKHLTFSMAALLAFYTGAKRRGKALIGHRGAQEYEILDDQAVLDFFAENSGKDAQEYTAAVLSRKEFWGQDLSEIPGLSDEVAGYLEKIRRDGMRSALEELG